MLSQIKEAGWHIMEASSTMFLFFLAFNDAKGIGELPASCHYFNDGKGNIYRKVGSSLANNLNQF